jgi:hypothetical protein
VRPGGEALQLNRRRWLQYQRRSTMVCPHTVQMAGLHKPGNNSKNKGHAKAESHKKSGAARESNRGKVR